MVTDAVLVPGGGDVKIESQKLNFKEKAQAKVGSLDNVGHLPAGGAVKVVSGSPRGARREGWGVQWSLGPSRWVLSPPLGLFRSHVSSSPLLFSHRLSLVLGKAGEAERPRLETTFP